MALTSRRQYVVQVVRAYFLPLYVLQVVVIGRSRWGLKAGTTNSGSPISAIACAFTATQFGCPSRVFASTKRRIASSGQWPAVKYCLTMFPASICSPMHGGCDRPAQYTAAIAWRAGKDVSMLSAYVGAACAASMRLAKSMAENMRRQPFRARLIVVEGIGGP